MGRAISTSIALVLLVVGIVLGGAGVYFGVGAQGHTTTIVQTATSTIIQTTTVTSQQSTTSTSTSTGSNGQLNLAELVAALNGTGNATIGIPSYEFGKGTLDMWILNNGTTPIVLAPQMIIYNGSYVNNTYFTILDPKVHQFGIYAYIPPGSQIIVQLTPYEPPITPSTASVQILDNNFTFVYGTSKD